MALNKCVYEIGDYGFLGDINKAELPEEYYNVFGNVLNNLENQNGDEFRQIVKDLPNENQEYYVSFVKDKSPNQIKKIYNDFTFICQKYIWCNGADGREHSLPMSIGIIWYYCGVDRVVRPVSTYDALILNNWKLPDETKPMDLYNNLEVIHSITGTEDEKWFYMIHIMGLKKFMKMMKV
jgi:indoleamine 2,3-dioxygenase